MKLNNLKQYGNNTKGIIELGKNEAFRKEFITNYVNAGESKYMAETQLVAAFQAVLLNKSANDIVQEPPLFAAAVDSVKRVLLTISSSGLLVDPKQKEIALFTSRSVNGEPFLDFMLCYRGMYKLVGLSKRVLSSCVEIIYDGDHFEWFGENQMPKYKLNFEHDKKKIKAGYCAFQMANGVVLAHLMSGEEIEDMKANAIEANKIAGGSSDVWEGPWQGRCIKSKIFKSAFTFYKASLLDSKEMISSITEEEEKPAIEDFASFLENQLNNIDEKQA